MPTFLLRFAKPTINGPHFCTFAASEWAVITTTSPTLDDALTAASDHATAAGWTPDPDVTCYEIPSRDHLDADEMLQCYDAAQTRGIAAFIETYKTRIVDTN